jgi:hypothetical protein
MISKRPPSSRDWTDDVQRLEQLLTVNQLAEHWQLSPRTIHRMIDQEVLPYCGLAAQSGSTQRSWPN